MCDRSPCTFPVGYWITISTVCLNNYIYTTDLLCKQLPSVPNVQPVWRTDTEDTQRYPDSGSCLVLLLQQQRRAGGKQESKRPKWDLVVTSCMIQMESRVLKIFQVQRLGIWKVERKWYRYVRGNLAVWSGGGNWTKQNLRFENGLRMKRTNLLITPMYDGKYNASYSRVFI